MKRKIRNFILSLLIVILVIVPKMEVRAATDITISNVNTTPSTIQPYSDFSVTLLMTNTSGVDLFDISLQIDDDLYSFKNSGSVQTIGDIDGDPADATKTKTITLNLSYNGNTSKKIPIKISYLKGVGKVSTTQNDSIIVNALVSDNSGTPTPPDTSKNLPNLLINNNSLPIVYTGMQNLVSFELKNIGAYSGSHITISPDISLAKTSKIRINQISLDPRDVTINTQKMQVFTLSVLIDGGLEAGNYPISLNISGTNPWGEPYSQVVSTSLNVVTDTSKTDYVKIKEQTQSIPWPKAGDSVDLGFTILNDSSSTIRNLEVWVEGLVGPGFGLINASSKLKLNELISAASNKFTFSYKISDTTVSGSYPYKLVYQYTNSDGNLIKKESDYNLFVASKDANAGAIEIGNIVYPSSVIQDQDFNVSFTIKNTGDVDLKHIKVTLDENTVFLPETSSVLTFDKLVVGSTANVKYTLIGTGDALKSRNYPLSFTVTYDGPSSSTTPLTTQQTLGVYITSTSEVDDSKSVPKIIIEKYAADPMIINAGSEFDLSLTFLNTHASKTIKNIKAFLTVTEVGKETTGSVFTPVNSSNTFYIDAIAPKESMDRQIRLFTVPDANPKTYTITVNFEYEDALGNPFTATELVGINVKQPTKIDTSEFQVPTEGYIGQPIFVYFDIYNTGKVKVYNLMVKAEGKFTADPSSYYIGNFESGTQDYYEGNIIPNEVGQLKGKFIISYDDSTGEHFEIGKDISLNIMDMMPIDPSMPVDGGFVDPMAPVEGEKKGLNYILISGIAAAVIAIVVTIIIVLKRRKAKKEGLMIDED
ncbi:MAG: hypothetical protein H7X94_14030 [Vallitaleaceae bacterium]|nr:hypothetical protein [Vallitaleaceae bacterium]